MDQDHNFDRDAVAVRPMVIAVVSFIALAVFLRWNAILFRAVAGLFYEQSAIAVLREPSQIVLAYYLSLLWLGFPITLTVASKHLSQHARSYLAIMALAYFIRAAIWIAGSNLPLVPGDSCHYVEVASSILRGEGPVKHYVESFFRDYPAIRRDEGVLDDWATPLYSYLLAVVFRVLGITPGDSIETTFAVAKGLSFALNLATLPIFQFFARRHFGSKIALQSMAVLAVLPVHSLYAGMELRESLVVLMTVLAVGGFLEMLGSKNRIFWAVSSGLFTGLAILSRNTAMATAAACGLYGFIAGRGEKLTLMFIWGTVAAAVISPWAYLTWREYGQPFYSYTQYFSYNFSWAVHHYEKGNTEPSQFFTFANLPEILRTKLKSIWIIGLYSTMIVSVPLVAGFFHRLNSASNAWDRLTALIALAYFIGTITGVADVTQVMQLGRYYVPLFVLIIPSAVAGLDSLLSGLRERKTLIACSMVALLWADPTWAYDFTWLSKSYQLHWPALQRAGQWVRNHPDTVPSNARIVTWFPWEFRLASRRTTILMNRSLFPPHIKRTIQNYQATHVLWGSFEPPTDIDPEQWGTGLAQIQTSLGLSPSDTLYRSPITTYPVALYRIEKSDADSEELKR